MSGGCSKPAKKLTAHAAAAEAMLAPRFDKLGMFPSGSAVKEAMALLSTGKPADDFMLWYIKARFADLSLRAKILECQAAIEQDPENLAGVAPGVHAALLAMPTLLLDKLAGYLQVARNIVADPTCACSVERIQSALSD